MNLANWKLYHYQHVILNTKCYFRKVKYNDIEIYTKDLDQQHTKLIPENRMTMYTA